MSKLEKMQNCRYCLKVTKYDWPEVHVYEEDFNGPRIFSSSINSATTVIAGQIEKALNNMKKNKKEGLIINFTFTDFIPGRNTGSNVPENQIELFNED